jgi:hypothetical protein
MILNRNLLIYLFIILLSFTYERMNIKCNNETLITIMISLLHHSFSVYIYFCSILFPYYKFNILIIILTILGWIFNKNRCVLSIYYNKVCSIKEKVQFHDLTHLLNSYLSIKNLHYYILGTIFLLNLYFLLKNKYI